MHLEIGAVLGVILLKNYSIARKNIYKKTSDSFAELLVMVCYYRYFNQGI